MKKNNKRMKTESPSQISTNINVYKFENFSNNPGIEKYNKVA